MNYRPLDGVHIGGSGVPDDPQNGLHIFHIDSMWTPGIVGFHGSDSRWSPDKVHVESSWSSSGGVA